MKRGDAEEILRVLDLCLSRVKWRLRRSARRRLETDILALCTGLRPVVMVDYGGKMPELQEHLCALLRLAQEVSTILLPLRVMVIEDMIYIVHVKGLADHTLSSLTLQHKLQFVDLEQDPPKMLLYSEQNAIVSELLSIQKLFSSLFPVDDSRTDLQPALPDAMMTSKAESSESGTVHLAHDNEHSAFQASDIVDLSRTVEDTQLTIPTLNGWLLGYPVVYLFSKEHASDAVYNLSTKSLHIYKIVISRNQISGSKPCEEELMSFTVPYDLSLGQEQEPWAESLLSRLLVKLESCTQVWANMRLEVSGCYPQAIVL